MFLIELGLESESGSEERDENEGEEGEETESGEGEESEREENDKSDSQEGEESDKEYKIAESECENEWVRLRHRSEGCKKRDRKKQIEKSKEARKDERIER